MNDFFLADDLSGALDAAAAFHRAGRRVRVVLSPAAWHHVAGDEVVGVTTETRNASPGRAAEVVRDLMASAARRGARLAYKKIDSTLRGPVAAELQAITEARPGTRILFAPANPRVGRIVRGGVLLVNGAPVAETDFGRDPGSPLRTSSVREILGVAATTWIEIPDTETEADLAAAVARMDAAGGAWIPVGSGALAVAVAARGANPAVATSPLHHRTPASPVLMVGGSAHPLNRAQAAALVAAHGVAIHEIQVERARDSGLAAADSLCARKTAALQLPATRTTPATALAAAVAASVTAIAAAGVRRIFCTGGETAYALCERLGIQSLTFLDEIEPGLSLSVGEAAVGPVLLAVKPGGFGDEQTWVRAWERLRSA